jgi:predicted house-cleaning noncanonical NTP pyrophosphatase (MazG superfamily)
MHNRRYFPMTTATAKAKKFLGPNATGSLRELTRQIKQTTDDEAADWYRAIHGMPLRTSGSPQELLRERAEEFLQWARVHWDKGFHSPTAVETAAAWILSIKPKGADEESIHSLPKASRDGDCVLAALEGRFSKLRRVTDDQEWLKLLLKKLREEVAELLKTPTDVEEVADCIEVLRAIAAITHPGADLDAIAAAKRARRGGYNNRLAFEGSVQVEEK